MTETTLKTEKIDIKMQYVNKKQKAIPKDSLMSGKLT
jgi:hypothetical protein